MRLFHSLSLENLSGKESSSPFLVSREKDARISLLNEVKERKQRVPTPEKTAVLKLASSCERRRLGKQQQILAGVAQRCREQEVNDLSEVMSAKCDLVSPRLGARTSAGTEWPFYMARPLNTDRASDVISDSFFYAGTTPINDRDENYKEKPYTFFPARRIIRQQNKLVPISGGHPSLLFHDYKKTRHSEIASDDFKSVDPPQTSQKHHHLPEPHRRSPGNQSKYVHPLHDKNVHPFREKSDGQVPSRLSYIQVGTSSYFTHDSAASLSSSNQNLGPPVAVSTPAYPDSHVGYRQHLLGSVQHKTMSRFHKLNISSDKLVPTLLQKSPRDHCGPKIPSLESLGMIINQNIDSPRS
ncbi:unnamed protein product [Lymnaea stagnalis]|uniref:Uncharacterized protein n=1 Tax=Lymnaea stagnalis TaxID=6523 RepID=A0AAV2IK95_LYMST